MPQGQESKTIQLPTAKQKMLPQNRLGFVFDIDGTLIAEGERVVGIVRRPGAVEFLRWLIQERGHAVALWTAAWSSHANAVCANLCRHVQGHDTHTDCLGNSCGKTFDFCWDVDKLRRQRELKVMYEDYNVCRWCEMYKYECDRCSFVINGAQYCACRYTKDLAKVWYDRDQETARFTSNRTLIVENTPQQCIWNYGNAIYVPTYRGRQSSEENDLFQRLKQFVLELEQVPDVRRHRKCSHPPGPHACMEQDWWYTPHETCMDVSVEGEQDDDHNNKDS